MPRLRAPRAEESSDFDRAAAGLLKAGKSAAPALQELGRVLADVGAQVSAAARRPWPPESGRKMEPSSAGRAAFASDMVTGVVQTPTPMRGKPDD